MKQLKAVLLIGGNDDLLPYGVLMSEMPITVLAIVTGPEVSSEQLMAVSESLPGNQAVFTTKRPDQEELLLQFIADNDIEIGISCFYEYRIRVSFIDAFSTGITNIHPAALPRGAGMHSPFWGIMEGGPFGATLHWMNEKIDMGKIIDQAVFDDDGIISAAEVRKKAREFCIELLRKNLPLIAKGDVNSTNQNANGINGQYHFADEIRDETTFMESDSIRMGDLVKLSRATNYLNNGFFVIIGDTKVQVRASVHPAED